MFFFLSRDFIYNIYFFSHRPNTEPIRPDANWPNQNPENIFSSSLLSHLKKKSAKKKEKEEMNDSVEDPCSICYERLLHPLTLPCGHYFCYLCLKGLSFKTVVKLFFSWSNIACEIIMLSFLLMSLILHNLK